MRMSGVAIEEEWDKTFALVKENLFLPVIPQSIDILSKQMDSTSPDSREFQILKLSRQIMLTKLLEKDRKEYLNTISLFGDRIPRSDLPNRQEVPLFTSTAIQVAPAVSIEGVSQVDCKLPNKTYSDNIIDKFLLGLFRQFVQEEVKFTSSKEGILGLLEEGRTFMLSPEGTISNQHRYVRTVLDRLLTPFLPPLYRVLFSGIVPSKEKNDPAWLVQLTDSIRSFLPESMQKEFAPGRQFGPWFYTPWITSAVTPSLLYFLVGPSSVNRRKDGQPGGMVVEKCKFLQESGCKGLCLHQCKLPAEQYFADTLGLPLTVSPNFETQECQWSFGEVPLDPADDPTFPRGCLVGCPSRGLLKEQELAVGNGNGNGNGQNRDLCSAVM